MIFAPFHAAITAVAIAPPTGSRWASRKAAGAWIAAARRKVCANTSSCSRSTAAGGSACAIRPDLCQGVSMNLLQTYDSLLEDWRKGLWVTPGQPRTALGRLLRRVRG